MRRKRKAGRCPAREKLTDNWKQRQKIYQSRTKFWFIYCETLNLKNDELTGARKKKDRKGEHHCSQQLQSAHWLVTINSWLTTCRCTLFQTGRCMWVHQTRWAAKNRDNSSTLITVVWVLTGMCDLAGVWGQTCVCGQAVKSATCRDTPPDLLLKEGAATTQTETWT